LLQQLCPFFGSRAALVAIDRRSAVTVPQIAQMWMALRHHWWHFIENFSKLG
jgi:hypothetical protein